MSKDNSFTHLTLEERRIILTGIEHGSTKTAIAQTLGKEKSTIGKEIKQHRVLAVKCTLPLECAAYRHCKYGRNCTPDCPKYEPFHCSRRDRSPGACNGCSKWNSCRFNKFKYNPEKAQMDYEQRLVDSRQGVNLTTTEAKAMADIIGPLLENGLSPYQILQMHPELGISEKTGQKGSLENMHVVLRYILPKGSDLRDLGLVDQNALNLVLSHVNSTSVESLNGRSPLEMADFAFHDLYEKLCAFGIELIDKDQIVLKPHLLKR